MDTKAAREILAPKRRGKKNITHTSFWMHPTTVSFIRNASERTRMPQGTILEIIITYYRLMRKKELLERNGERPSLVDQQAIDNIQYFLRVIPY